MYSQNHQLDCKPFCLKDVLRFGINLSDVEVEVVSDQFKGLKQCSQIHIRCERFKGLAQPNPLVPVEV